MRTWIDLIVEGASAPKTFRVSFCDRPHAIVQQITVEAKSFADARRQGKEWLTYCSPGGQMKIAYIHQQVGDEWLGQGEIKMRRAR